jgi:hypothetical protein
MIDPATVSVALRAAGEARKALDGAALRARLEGFQRSLDDIGLHLSSTVVAEVRAGFRHLETAATAVEGDFRRDELNQARSAFARLAERPDTDPVLDAHAELSAAHVAALGHFGNYHYFLLRDQVEQGLREAYRCTERFPALGVRMFPAELFSRDYRAEIPSVATRYEWNREYEAAMAHHKQERRRYGLDMAWRVPAAAGAVVAFLAAGAVSPPLAPRGLVVAGQLLSRAEAPPSAPDKRAYLERAAEVERRLAPVVVEAAQRRAAVERQLIA